MNNRFEPIPVSLHNLMDMLEKEIANPNDRWIQLRQFLEKQETAQQSVKRTTKKRRAKGDKFDPRDVAILGGDPSL